MIVLVSRYVVALTWCCLPLSCCVTHMGIECVFRCRGVSGKMMPGMVAGGAVAVSGYLVIKTVRDIVSGRQIFPRGDYG